MKRMKHHKIKKEKAESSTQIRATEEHDLAYYIHDRVELMHQVFSLLKYKELKAMAPESVRNLTIGDLEELCTEELLGISSKRLLAILDGVEPPSDTESSSPSPPPELETISLDSISSDEELLSTSSKKKKHKHHRHSSKSKSKKREKSGKSNKSDKSKQAAAPVEENSELSKASRAGLTVLELLELQARARAIRAQLQQEQANKRPSETTAAESSPHSSDNEVEIKEERPEVVEISSEDEKPDVEKLKKNIAEKSVTQKVTNKEPQKEPEVQQSSQKVTKRVNDLIITVPQAATRKIKLNRNKITVTTPTNVNTPIDTSIVNNKPQESAPTVNNPKPTPEKPKDNKLKKKKKDKKKKTVEKDGSDHDEITLQLSDSEKMDLLENLDESRKNYDKVSSSSEDSENSSSETDDGTVNTSNNTSHSFVEPKLIEKKVDETNKVIENSPPKTTPLVENAKESADKETSAPSKKTSEELDSTECLKEIENTNSEVPLNPIEETQQEASIIQSKSTQNTEKELTQCNENIDGQDAAEKQAIDNNEKVNTIDSECKDKIIEVEVSNSSTDVINDTYKLLQVTTSSNAIRSVTVVDKPVIEEGYFSKHDTSPPKVDGHSEKVLEINTIEDIPVLNEKSVNNSGKESHRGSHKNDKSPKGSEHNLSDGEISDHQSSEIEAVDVQPEVVCISDEESPKKKSEKKKKKKEKKAKKEKKSKKTNSDFRESSDQNFYKDTHLLPECDSQDHVKSPNNETSPHNTFKDKPIDLDSDDVHEILELSDDSSCYEVEGTVLSKEPTTEEIEALSARIDEIEREEVVTEEQIRRHEQMLADNMIQKEPGEPNEGNADDISWKDRYLDSKKVKKVLTTANILNALRKKNKELKKKIQDSKKKEEEEKQLVAEETETLVAEVLLEEGSIEQYKTLQGSTKYVDPVKEPVQENQDLDQKKNEEKDQSEELVTATSIEETNVTREMKKDARQLLKMYRKLLKYNDMNKQKDPNKKKKKKLKKKDKNNSESKSISNLTEVLNI